MKKSDLNIRHLLQQAKEYTTHVVFILSMRTETAFLLLKEAQELNYIWPKYAWIVFSVDDDLDTFAGDLEGIFLTHDYSRIGLNKILARFFSSDSVMAPDALNISLPG